jgi:hypothetical protein
VLGDDLPAAGASVTISMAAGRREKPLVVNARIAWKRPQNRLGNLAGVEFVGLSDEARAWLRQQLRSEGGK